MKKLLITTAIALMFIGCSKDETVKEPFTEHDHLIEYLVGGTWHHSVNGETNGSSMSFEYDGTLYYSYFTGDDTVVGTYTLKNGYINLILPSQNILYSIKDKDRILNGLYTDALVLKDIDSHDVLIFYRY